eukprot:gnl/TRDRNA2_/TRDRNA2_85295_c0_seq1.p1 gnl/TRDRNA2_/TRDRNA2_85295_c0~~gnl/TRDRNA2_/TRDRNA2_85295_c0_seq1.p1  ORF type:complete len:318 (-),score=31.33 gnl/TRDRNA2_/TRDRNA2_85295_c0_seq1:117-1070(-)
MRTIHEFDVQELSNTAWAFAFSSDRHPQLSVALRNVSLALGRRKDKEKHVEPQLWRNVVDVSDQLSTPLGYDKPEIVHNTPGLVVIFKPAGWETDVYDVAKFGVPITTVARFYLLSSFLASQFPEEQFPICHSVKHGFGFVHRLDQMSSGLIITTTSFECHFLMQWAMCSYYIQREYFVLCHGLVPCVSGGVTIAARIREGAMRARSTYGERCCVDKRGKPAVTHIRTQTHQHLGDREEPLCAVAISILTGRQHQIRVHLQHIGNPTVYDGRYTQESILLTGMRLEDLQHAPKAMPRPRPLPERHRIELTMRSAYPW